MVLKATVQKQSYNQSLCNVSSETAVSRCFSKFRNRKIPVLESLFNKLAGLKVCNFTKRLKQRRFPVNFVKFLRAAFFIEYLRCLLFSA